VDAVLVGAETVRADNPRLTIRGTRSARQPWRVVLTRSGKLPRRARLFSDRLAARTLIYKGHSLAGVLKNLGKRGITNVLIEGGGEVLSQALDARLIDKVQLYLGPILNKCGECATTTPRFISAHWAKCLHNGISRGASIQIKRKTFPSDFCLITWR
jgi:diaminohydroxyphosphoribosylaminopyrimidine deaminase/5-amino-6-(5-phosphoribosylamino)uracil reductase